jgi:hypothetical protein
MESLERGVFSRGLKMRKNVTKCGKVLTGGSPPTPPTPTPMMLSSDASGTLHSKRTHDRVSESKRAWVLGAELHLALFEGTTMNPRIILLKV